MANKSEELFLAGRDYTVWVFIHYYQQIQHLLRLRPRKVLEIGPGDYTVADFLRKKGITVKTFDIDPNTRPDYVGDVREQLEIDERYDTVLASEVFEHMDIRWLERALQNITKVIMDGGWMVVSLPYSTIRLFPERSKYGRIVSCEGRLRTYIPFYWIQPMLTLTRAIYRILRGRFRDAFEYVKIREWPDDRIDVHHWDLGWHPTTRKVVREIFAKHFTVVEEKAYVNTNCVFFILRKD